MFFVVFHDVHVSVVHSALLPASLTWSASATTVRLRTHTVKTIFKSICFGNNLSLSFYEHYSFNRKYTIKFSFVLGVRRYFCPR